jgi:hypothetical protein
LLYVSENIAHTQTTCTNTAQNGDFRMDYLCLWSVAYCSLWVLLKQFMDDFSITYKRHPGKQPDRIKDGGSDG